MKTASLQDCPIHRSVHTKPISQSAGVLVATNLQYRLIINNERMLLSCGQLELEPDSSTNHHEEGPSEYTKHFCVVIVTHHAQEFSPKISRGETIRGEDQVHGFLRNFQASELKQKNYPENQDSYQVLRFFCFVLTCQATAF